MSVQSLKLNHFYLFYVKNSKYTDSVLSFKIYSFTWKWDLKMRTGWADVGIQGGCDQMTILGLQLIIQPIHPSIAVYWC
jgi:hypothetical protein